MRTLSAKNPKLTHPLRCARVQCRARGVGFGPYPMSSLAKREEGCRVGCRGILSG